MKTLDCHIINKRIRAKTFPNLVNHQMRRVRCIIQHTLFRIQDSHDSHVEPLRSMRGTREYTAHLERLKTWM